MNKYEIRFALANISNKIKLKLLQMYNNEENIYNNIYEILKSDMMSLKDKIKIKEDSYEDKMNFVKALNDNSIKTIRITEEDYPEWDRYCTVRAAIRQSFDYNTGWGEGKTIKLPIWFNKDEYDDIFDTVLANYSGYQDLDKTTFINGYDAEKMKRYN